MYYSRPKIEPLGWDLADWPTPNGTKHYDGITSDNRPVDFWFSSGWLTVSRGPVGAPPDTPEMEEIFSLPIAPFGIMDIQAAQICDICGVTVNGQKIDSRGIPTGARGFDWSGETTYWWSTHMLLDGDDARVLVDQLLAAFSGSILVQPQWGSHGKLRCRRVKFLLSSDDIVCLGVEWNKGRLEALVSGNEVSTELYERVFDYSVTISRDDGVGNDPTGSMYVHQNGGGELDYSVAHHRLYRISTSYRTSRDPQEKTDKLISVIDDYFRRGLKMVNLETSAIIAESVPDDTDEKSYSKAVRDKCLAEDKRYVYVSKSLPQNPLTPGESLFYGLRPTALD